MPVLLLALCGAVSRVPTTPVDGLRLAMVTLWIKDKSVPKRQNPFPLVLVKNELGAVSESLGPPLSRPYPIMTIAGLKSRPKVSFQNPFPLHLLQPQIIKPLPIAKAPSHCL